jgi:hypothetical protein
MATIFLNFSVKLRRKYKKYNYRVRFEVFTAVTKRHAVFWNVTACGCLKTDVSEERLHNQGDKSR